MIPPRALFDYMRLREGGVSREAIIQDAEERCRNEYEETICILQAIVARVFQEKQEMGECLLREMQQIHITEPSQGSLGHYKKIVEILQSTMDSMTKLLKEKEVLDEKTKARKERVAEELKRMRAQLNRTPKDPGWMPPGEPHAFGRKMNRQIAREKIE